MGSNLCCMRNPSPSEKVHSGEEIIETPRKGERKEVSIIGDLTLKQCLLDPSNLKDPKSFISGKDDGGHGAQVKIMGTTLKQCLLDSPNLNPQFLANGGLAQDYYLPSPQVQLNSHQTRTLNSPYTPEWRDTSSMNHHVLSSPEVRAEFFTPRLSLSAPDKLGKLGEVDERDDEEEEMPFTSIIKRSQISARLKKKVSFRFPQEADIYMFYPPSETFEEKKIT